MRTQLHTLIEYNIYMRIHIYVLNRSILLRKAIFLV